MNTMKKMPELNKYFYITGWIAIVLTLGAYFLLSHGYISLKGLIRPCLTHALTGYYCPGCGGTRAFCALLTGHPLRALYYHPIVPYTAAVGGWFMLSQSVQYLSRGKIRIGLNFRPIYLYLAAGILLGNWALRNALLFFFGIALME